jgi:hypothetical protein
VVSRTFLPCRSCRPLRQPTRPQRAAPLRAQHLRVDEALSNGLQAITSPSWRIEMKSNTCTCHTNPRTCNSGPVPARILVTSGAMLVAGEQGFDVGSLRKFLARQTLCENPLSFRTNSFRLRSSKKSSFDQQLWRGAHHLSKVGSKPKGPHLRNIVSSLGETPTHFPFSLSTLHRN